MHDSSSQLLEDTISERREISATLHVPLLI